MFCGYCGKRTQNDTAFCPYCGKALKPIGVSDKAGTLPQEEEPTVDSAPVLKKGTIPAAEATQSSLDTNLYCAICGKPLRSNAQFCSFCGTAAEPKPAKGKRSDTTDTTSRQASAVPTQSAFVPQSVFRDAGRRNTVNDFAFVPEAWKQSRPDSAQNSRTSSNPVSGVDWSAAKEKAVRYGSVVKEKAVQYGGVAKEKAVQYGGIAKEQAKKLGTAVKEKTADSVGKLQAMPAKKLNRIEKNAFSIASVTSLLSLLLIVLAAFVPYCQIAYSADRAANMPLFRLIFGGTYTMGDTNPLRFTLKAHPELLALLLLPMLILLLLCVRKAKARAWAASGILFADGLAVVIWNRTVLHQMQSIVSGLSLETFEKHVVSMNSVVIKWVQNVLQGNLSFRNTFFLTGKLGYGLIGLFGWSAMLIGVAGLALCLILLFVKKNVNKTMPPQAAEKKEDDDVPELSGEWL